jgi:hypothetical protein
MNRIQQFFPHPLAVPCLCEFIHNRPFMNLEAVRQLQATIACQHGTDSWQHLTLPFGNIFERFLCFFCQVSLFLHGLLTEGL